MGSSLNISGEPGFNPGGYLPCNLAYLSGKQPVRQDEGLPSIVRLASPTVDATKMDYISDEVRKQALGIHDAGEQDKEQKAKLVLLPSPDIVAQASTIVLSKKISENDKVQQIVTLLRTARNLQLKDDLLSACQSNIQKMSLLLTVLLFGFRSIKGKEVEDVVFPKEISLFLVTGEVALKKLNTSR